MTTIGRFRANTGSDQSTSDIYTAPSSPSLLPIVPQSPTNLLMQPQALSNTQQLLVIEQELQDAKDCEQRTQLTLNAILEKISNLSPSSGPDLLAFPVSSNIIPKSHPQLKPSLPNEFSGDRHCHQMKLIYWSYAKSTPKQKKHFFSPLSKTRTFGLIKPMFPPS